MFQCCVNVSVTDGCFSVVCCVEVNVTDGSVADWSFSVVNCVDVVSMMGVSVLC